MPGVIPIVGRPADAHEAIAMAIITCRCAPENVPMLILNVQYSVVCPRCRNIYRIMRVHFDAVNGEPLVADVALVGRQPESPTEEN